MDITTFEALVLIQDSPNSCTQCGTPCSSQKDLRKHIDKNYVADCYERELDYVESSVSAKHITKDEPRKLMHPGDNNKRSRSSSESSLRTIPDADLVAEMTYTIMVLNDKRELFEEQKKLDKEIIQKLEIKISEILNKAKEQTQRHASISRRRENMSG